MVIKEVEDFIKNTHGRIFSIKFVKRSTGEERKMVCRTGVKSALKGGEPSYDAGEKGLITVFDMQKNGYRSIPKEGIKQILISGEWKDIVQ